jgi:hypothetical protein
MDSDVSNVIWFAAEVDDAVMIGNTGYPRRQQPISRDAHFLFGLEKAGVDFVAADMPNANRLTVRIMVVMAVDEREGSAPGRRPRLPQPRNEA